MKKTFSIIFMFLLCISTVSYAHKGRTDEYGGHYNRSTGTYHYHSGDYVGTGEYTAPIEEGGTLISNENTLKDGSDDLVVKDTSDELLSSQQNEIDLLQDQIYAKENTIEYLNEQLNEKDQQIAELEDSKYSIYFCFAIILLIAVYITYNINKSKK